MTLRFTSNRRAGTLRKLVAVGTERLFSMLVTMAAPTPRNGSRVDPSGTTTDAGGVVTEVEADAGAAADG